jgi:acyl carrier protein
MDFEKMFEIEIPDDAAAKMVTLRDVREFVLGEYQRLGRPTDPGEIFERIRAVTVNFTTIKPDKIGLDTRFIDDLGLD